VEPFADVSDYVGRTQTELTAAQDVTVDQRLRQVSDEFRWKCGQTVWPQETRTLTFRRLQYVQRLFLPHPPAIPLTVDSVTVDGLLYAGWTLDRTHTLVSDDVLGWSGNVQVDYTVGFVEPPAAVQGLILDRVERSMANPTGAVQETEGPFSRSYGSPTLQGWRQDELDLIERFRAVAV
jgi:hypothetical protein